MIESIITFIIAPVLILMISASIFNKRLPEWFCKHLSWHLAPNKTGFDGCSATGTCPRCGKSVLQDSQGNWF